MKPLLSVRTFLIIVIITIPLLSSEQNSANAGVHTVTGIFQDAGESGLSFKSALAGQNLTPYQPSGWDNKLVISATTGTSTSISPIWSNQTLYVDWAVTNNGTVAITQTFYSKLYIDGVLKNTWNTSSLAAGYFAYIEDYSIGTLSVGSHLIRIDTDATGLITETSETDNSYTRTITVYPYVNLTNYQPSGWDNKLVISTVSGTNTSDSQILDTENIYLDWAVANVSSYSTTVSFYIDLYIDNAWKASWTRTGLNANTFSTQLDYLFGKLSAGSHTFKVKIDVDNFVPEYNETDNEYSRTITVYNKNILPYKPGTWDNKIVLSTVAGTTISAAAIYNNQDIYVDWAVQNNGSAAVTESFHTKLFVDGVQKGYWYTAGIASNIWQYVGDHNIGKLATGNHTVQIVTDCDWEVAETSEADNTYTRYFYVGPSYNLTPFQPSGWDNKLVLSTVTGTNTSASIIYDTQDIYIDWACINNGYDDFTTTFYIRLYVDGVSRLAWTKGGLNHNTYTPNVDQYLGKLAAGTHTVKLVVDSDSHVTESDETDNEYSRTITVVNKNLLQYQPVGWDNKIVLSTVTGTYTSATSFCEDDPVYLDYSILNNGSATIPETFYVRLYVDGVAKATWTRTGLGDNTYYTIQDFSLGILSAGSHTLKIVADVSDNVDETSEADNEYSRTITVTTCKNLTPYQPAAWDNKIVLSTGTGTYTSSSPIYDNQPIYLDWAVINNGVNNITENFTVKLYVDAVLKSSWTRSGLNAGVYLYNSDFVVGTLPAGSHIFKIVADADNAVVESSESDNQYSRSFTVLSSTLAAPVANAATGITQTGFTANWNAVAGVTGYYLDVSTEDDFSSFVTGYNKKNVSNVLTYSVTGLSSGTIYYYRVWAYNSVNTSANSNPITLTTIPPAPVAEAASNIAQTSFNATWNATSGVSGYRLDVATDNAFTSFVSGFNNKDVGNVLNYSVTGLTLGTTYYYRLRAYNTAGASPNSNTITVKTLVNPPTTPVATAATSITQISFSANWSATSGATGYYLDVSTSNTFDSFVTGYNNKDVGNVLTASVTGLNAGTTYYYRLRSNGPGGTSANSNTITVVTTPPAPVAKDATEITNNSFNANWDASTSATGYFLDVSTSNTFSSFVSGYKNKDVGNFLTYAITGLAPGTAYYYRVSAYNSTSTSPNSNTIYVGTGIPRLDALEATNITRTSFSANWNVGVAAIGYFLEVSASSSFESYVTGYQHKDVGNVLTASVTSLTPCITYYYRVIPYYTSDEGHYSDTITVVLTNNAPTVINKIPDYQMNTGQTLNIPISPVNGLIFYDIDPGDVLSVSGTKLSGAPLPSFISRSGDILTVNPALADSGCLNIVVKASDVCLASVTDTFMLCVNYLNTGISELYMQPEFKLYPNPTTGKVRIETNAVYKNIWVTVYNVLGSKIFSKEYFVNEPVIFDLSGGSPGMYLVRLSTATFETSKNVILDKLK
jgi:subtilase family serine protease